jgi:hypothetical protein
LNLRIDLRKLGQREHRFCGQLLVHRMPLAQLPSSRQRCRDRRINFCRRRDRILLVRSLLFRSHFVRCNAGGRGTFAGRSPSRAVKYSSNLGGGAIVFRNHDTSGPSDPEALVRPFDFASENCRFIGTELRDGGFRGFDVFIGAGSLLPVRVQSARCFRPNGRGGDSIFHRCPLLRFPQVFRR